MKTTTLALAFVLVAGCGGKPAPADDFADFSLDVKSDSFTSKSKFIGTYGFGQKIPLVDYTRTPRYRMLGLSGQAGLLADIWVRSTTGGDAVAWLLDDHKKVIAFNDDADDNTLDSHLSAALPQSKGWFLVIREYSGHKSTFQVMANANTTPAGATTPQEAYDLALSSLDSYAAVRADLPSAARTQYDAYQKRLGAASAYVLPTDSIGNVYAVSSNAEEYYYVDLYDDAGHFVAHGESGDGGPEVNGWSATKLDPSSI